MDSYTVQITSSRQSESVIVPPCRGAGTEGSGVGQLRDAVSVRECKGIVNVSDVPEDFMGTWDLTHERCFLAISDCQISLDDCDGCVSVCGWRIRERC